MVHATASVPGPGPCCPTHHGARHGPATASETYQTSTMDALLDGIYDGDVTIAELLTHGDFGLGTFNHLDGEMVILDGVCHHLHADGSASIAVGDDRTPFAVVTWFGPEITIPVSSPASRPEVRSLIDKAIKTTNLIQAIRIGGSFRQVRTRTVMAQSPPYPPMTQATANEPITDFSHVAGTLAGFAPPTTSRSPWPVTTCTSSTRRVPGAATAWTTKSKAVK
jgi:acetolactate decarboxylase